MHKRGLCRHAVCVCVSDMFMCCVKTNKDIFEIFPPSDSQVILVFLCQTGWWYSDGNSHNGGVECRWVGKNAKPYESRSVNNKAATNGGKRRAKHSRRRASSVVRTRRRRSVCDGLDVIRRRQSTQYRIVSLHHHHHNGCEILGLLLRILPICV